MAAADATSSILVGPHVAGVDFRNPVLFAKECATIDLLSEGRFTLGMGAGWSEKDYAIAGIHQDDALTRIERLREAVTIMKGLWGDGPFSFEGDHYQVAEVDAVPKPFSPIPIMIGGGGPKILTLAAEEADIVGINPKIVGRKINPESMATAAADAMDEKIDVVRAAAGDTFDDLELQVQIFKTVVTDQPEGGRRATRPGVRSSGRRRPQRAVLPDRLDRADHREHPGDARALGDQLRPVPDRRDRPHGARRVATRGDLTATVRRVVTRSVAPSGGRPSRSLRRVAGSRHGTPGGSGSRNGWP